jgi:hypothetical protein
MTGYRTKQMLTFPIFDNNNNDDNNDNKNIIGILQLINTNDDQCFNDYQIALGAFISFQFSNLFKKLNKDGYLCDRPSSSSLLSISSLSLSSSLSSSSSSYLVALEFLSPKYKDPSIRAKGVVILMDIDDDTLIIIMSILITLIKYEHHEDSPLARYLLSR